MNIEQQVNELEQLKANIQTNESKQQRLLLERSQIFNKTQELKNAYNGYASGYERQKTDQNKSQMDSAKKEWDTENQRLNDIDGEIKRLASLIDADKTKLEATKITVSIQQLQKQHAKVADDQKKIEATNNLIDEQNRIIEAAKDKANSTVALRKQRGLLLAEAAAGADNSKEISALDAKIAKAESDDQQQNEAKATAATKAHETAEGLHDMLARQKKQLMDDQNILAYMRDAALCELANEAAENYKAAAHQLAESIKTISVIDDLIAKTGIKPSSGVCPVRLLLIIPPIGSMERKEYNGNFLYTMTGEPPAGEERAAILAGIVAKGIEG